MRILGIDRRAQEALTLALAWHALQRTGGFDPPTGGRVEGALPLVYVDKNPWGRQRDDPAIARNASEAQAFKVLVDRFRSGSVRLAYSNVSFSEGAPKDGSESASRVALREVIHLSLRGLPLVLHVEMDDTEMVKQFLFDSQAIKGFDAVHGAASLLEGAWYFVTGDDRLRKRLNALYQVWGLTAEAGTPVDAVAWLDRGSPL
jgi:hypothetical protein